MATVTSDKKSIENVFGDIPMALYKAANLNLTFDDSEETFGIANENGKY